jgi:hypothetical protein
MLIVYVARLSSTSRGVVNKIVDQIDFWQSKGNTVHLLYASTEQIELPEKISSSHISIYKQTDKFTWLLKIYKELLDINPDIVYARTFKTLPYAARICRKYRVVFEINTVIQTEIQVSSPNANLINKAWKLSANKILKKGTGYIAVTNEIANSYKNLLPKNIEVIPNGIDMNETSIIKKVNNNPIPSLFFIGSANQRWHGLDKIEKIARLTQGKLIFHIIGVEKSKINNNLPENLFYHGYMKEKEYNNLISKFDIGVGTLALHRKKMMEACPLKVREYLSKGFPVIIAYQEMLPTDNKYILQISNTEHNVEDHIDEIVEFCQKNKNTIVNHILFQKHIDSKILEIQRLNYFKRLIAEE